MAPEQMSLEQCYLVCERVWLDPSGHMERFLVIRTKGDDETAGELVKLRLNRTQGDILDVIKDMWARKVPVRLIILKARQMGVSTFIEGLFFMLVTNNHNTQAWIVTHEVKASENLFDMSTRFLDNLDERISPMVANRTRKVIKFGNPDPGTRKVVPGLDSLIYIDTAKNVNAGRSATINFLHISERAFMPSSKAILSLMQAVPKTAKSIVVQESTANGVSDAGGFHEAWTANYGKPRARWRCLFFPWFIHDEYQMAVADHDKGPDGRLKLIPDPDGEMREDMLRSGVEYINVWGEREFHEITDERLVWRRFTMETDCDNDPYKFMQENPTTPQEAFVQSGRPWWSRHGLEMVRKTITPPIARGFLRTPTPAFWINDAVTGYWREDHFHPRELKHRRCEVQWVHDEGGDWWIWRIPEEFHEYLIAVDTAEGGEDGDKAAIQIFDRHSLEQVAEFNGYLDTDLLAHQVAMAAWFYNMAYVIPEVNNTGYGFMKTFERLWRRMYMRQDPDQPMNTKPRWIYGFLTNSATRNILVTRGQNYVREGVPTIRSSRLYDEMTSFVKDKRGIPRAAGKAYDDLVMAFLLILELHESRPTRRFSKERREVTLWDDKSFQEHVRRMSKQRHGTARRIA